MSATITTMPAWLNAQPSRFAVLFAKSHGDVRSLRPQQRRNLAFREGIMLVSASKVVVMDAAGARECVTTSSVAPPAVHPVFAWMVSTYHGARAAAEVSASPAAGPVSAAAPSSASVILACPGGDVEIAINTHVLVQPDTPLELTLHHIFPVVAEADNRITPAAAGATLKRPRVEVVAPRTAPPPPPPSDRTGNAGAQPRERRNLHTVAVVPVPSAVELASHYTLATQQQQQQPQHHPAMLLRQPTLAGMADSHATHLPTPPFAMSFRDAVCGAMLAPPAQPVKPTCATPSNAVPAVAGGNGFLRPTLVAPTGAPPAFARQPATAGLMRPPSGTSWGWGPARFEPAAEQHAEPARRSAAGILAEDFDVSLDDAIAGVVESIRRASQTC
jgi:hypothetical protein